MTREEAIQWLKHINITDFGWDDYAMQDSQKEIRERCEQSIIEAIDMAIEALSSKPKLVRVEYSPFTVEETSTPTQTSFRGTQEVHYYEVPSAEAVSREDTVTLNSPISIPADMVAVVRCKDCVYKQYDVTHNFCEINYHKCYDDDFCSWGERREP